MVKSNKPREKKTKKDATINVQSVRDGKNTVDAMTLSKTVINRYARGTPKEENRDEQRNM